MKRISSTAMPLLVAGAVVIALAVAAAAVASGTRSERSGSTADQVRATERALLKAAVDADTATAGRLLAPDFQLIDVLGATESRSNYLANLGRVIANVLPRAPAERSAVTRSGRAVSR